ncbi:MAG: M23 family metallopeptidase [Planctomycetes bacterium]|nr:M23 family metallopeptidase [Planctomycetota bacterium]
MRAALVCCASFAAISFALGAVPPQVAGQPPRPVLRGVPAGDGHDCLTYAQRASIEQRITENRKRIGISLLRTAKSAAAPDDELLYPFYPMGGTVDEDILHVNFVDLDPASPEVQDFHCTGFTYDGHRGIDTPLRSFAEQLIGVPVYAVLDGIVIEAHDGEPDMNTIPQGQFPNFVAIDHGLGRDVYYIHLRNGSVSVAVGDIVNAGEQIGLAASSGNSSGPHLHFESQHLGQAFEPFAGPCRTGASGWENQPAFHDQTSLYDIGVTNVDLFQVQGLPHPLPAHGQISKSDSYIYIWMQFENLYADATWRFAFIRPDGSTAYDSGSFPFDYGVTYRAGWVFFYWYLPGFVPDMQTIGGTWHVDVYFSEQLMAHAPVEVVDVVDPDFNRSPEPIGVLFDPAAPTVEDVVFCRVQGPSLIDDRDYDVVRFHYVWEVNDQVVRDVVSAGRADALRRELARPGDTLRCTVTPSDGQVDATPASVSVTVGGPPGLGDFDMDGDVDLTDYARFQRVFRGP